MYQRHILSFAALWNINGKWQFSQCRWVDILSIVSQYMCLYITEMPRKQFNFWQLFKFHWNNTLLGVSSSSSLGVDMCVWHLLNIRKHELNARSMSIDKIYTPTFSLNFYQWAKYWMQTIYVIHLVTLKI